MLFGRRSKKIAKDENKVQPVEEKVVEPAIEESIKIEEPKEEAKQEITRRYVYGFRAKLIVSDEVTQNYYHEIIHELQCLGIKTRESFRQIRCYVGKQPLAVLVFKGKKLSMAFALDPKTYEDTKYRGIDLSDKKRYEKTPLLLKLTSSRKLVYVKYLLSVVASENGLTRMDKSQENEIIPSLSLNELIARNLVKVVFGKTIVAEDLDEDDEEDEDFYVSDPVIIEKPVVKKNLKNKKIGIVNLDSISKYFDTNETISLAILKEKGLVSEKMNCIKILARGNVDKPFVVEAELFSAEAKRKIYSAGGTIKQL